jgi:flagellin-like protein
MIFTKVERGVSMKKNKRGVSAIVATVLVILITIAVATIVSVTVVPMVRNQLQSGELCFDATSQIQLLDQGYTCYENYTGGINVSVQVNRLSKDFDLAGFQILMSSEGNTKSFEVNSSDGLPGTPGTKVYEFNYSASRSVAPDQVQIAPIVSVGNSENTCDVSSTITLREC